MNFAQVEKEVAQLRQELDADRLTEEQFKTRLRELMVEDEDGNWWMVGYETGEWYRHDSADWVRADPPGRLAPEPTPTPTAPPVHAPSKPTPQPDVPAKPRQHRSLGTIVFLLGLGISIAVGWLAAAATQSILCNHLSVDYDSTNAIAFAIWGAVGLGGLILTIKTARKLWRGK